MTWASASSASASSGRPPPRKAVADSWRRLRSRRRTASSSPSPSLAAFCSSESTRRSAETRLFSPAFMAAVRSCLTLSANSTASMIRPSARAHSPATGGPGSSPTPALVLAPSGIAPLGRVRASVDPPLLGGHGPQPGAELLAFGERGGHAGAHVLREPLQRPPGRELVRLGRDPYADEERLHRRDGAVRGFERS